MIDFVVLPSFICLIVVPLSTMFIYLFKSRKNLEVTDIKHRLFVLVNSYKDRYFFWEYIILLKKIGLIFTSIFLNHRPIISCLSMLIIILISCVLLMIFEPFKRKEYNDLEITQRLFLGYLTLCNFVV